MSPGHYFDADPAVPSRPRRRRAGAARLSRPLDRRPGRVLRRRRRPGHPGAAAGFAAPACPTGDLLDLGCGYGPIACTLARRAPARRCGRWTSTTGPSSSPLATPPPSAWPAVRAVRPDGVPASVRFAGMWSNPPIRIGKAALHASAERLVAPPATRRGGLAGGAPAPGRRLAGRLAGRARAGAVNRAGSKRGYRILEVAPAVRAARPDRPQAPAPRVEPPHGGTAGAAARRRAIALQRRRHRAHGGGLPGRPPVPGGGHRLARARQGGEAVHGHGALPVLDRLGTQSRRRRRGPRRRLHRGRPGAGRRRRPAAPAAPRPRRVPGARPRGPRPAARPRWRPATRWPSCPRSGGSAASTWPPPPPSPSTSSAARVGSGPAGHQTRPGQPTRPAPATGKRRPASPDVRGGRGRRRRGAGRAGGARRPGLGQSRLFGP